MYTIHRKNCTYQFFPEREKDGTDMTPCLRRIAITLLCICTLCTSVCTGSASQPEESVAPIHYVIVTDMTDTNDSAQIRQSLADLIMNLIPLENTRISLICYGYKDAKDGAFPYSGSVKTMEGEYVHEITLSDESLKENVVEYRNDLIRTLCSLSVRSDRKSPHGHALLASMQHMEKAGTPDKKGCVILISDGNRASNNPNIDNSCKEEALRISQAHHWPIYTIALNQENSHLSLSDNPNYDTLNSGNATRNEFPYIFMTEVAWKSGATRIDPNGNNASYPGTWVIGGTPPTPDIPLEDFHMTQAHRAALEILGFQPKEYTFGSDGIMDIPFTIPDLTCEYLFYLQNTKPDNISVFPVSDDNEPLTDKPVEENILQKTSGNSYSAIRLLCPTPGKYVLRVKGQPTAKIITGSRIVIDPDLRITFLGKSGNPLAHDDNENLLLPCGDPLSVVVECWYGETLLVLSDDETYTAQLILELDKQNHTNDSYDTILDTSLDGNETNWFLKGDYFSEDNIHPDNNTHNYRANIKLIPNDTKSLPQFEKEYHLITVTSDPTNEAEEIKLGDIPPLGTAEFSMEEFLDDMPPGSLKYSLVGLDNTGKSFHLLSPEDQHAYTELIGNYRLLTLQTNNCVGEYEASLTVSCFDNSKSFALLFTITEPEDLEIDDFDIVLYDREPLKFFRNFIKDYDISHSPSWDNGITLLDLTGCNSQIVHLSPNSDGNVIFTACSVGEADITATLTNNICRMDPNHMPQYYTDDCTIHVTVKSMAIREIWCCALILVIVLVLVCLFYFLIKSSKVSYVVVYSDGGGMSKKESGTFHKKDNLHLAISKSRPENDAQFPNNDDIGALENFTKNTYFSPLLFSCLPILVTNIPDDCKVYLGNKAWKLKFALVTKKRSLQLVTNNFSYQGNDPLLRINKITSK